MIDAFEQLGIEARPLVPVPGGCTDLVIDPGGVGATLHLKHRSLVTDDVAGRLLSEATPSGDKNTLLVVADRVTVAARTLLRSRRGGYLDLRGRLALRADGLVIDAEIEPIKEPTERSGALSGKAGLEVATALLTQPDRPVAVLPVSLHRSAPASTTSSTGRGGH